MAWNISGELIETCSCNMFCPCWFGEQELMVMDQGWCASTFMFRIQSGNADGVDLSDRTVVLGTDFPGPTLFDGGGMARLYIDDDTSQEQRQQLESIFHGEKGGPMEVIAGLVSNWLPTQAAPIDIQQQDGSLTATVGDFGTIRSQPMTNEAGQPVTMQNAGLMVAFRFDNQQAQLAPSGSRWSDPDFAHQFDTRSGAIASITWHGD